MKTNAVFVLLLVAAIVVAVACEPEPKGPAAAGKWESKIAGSYKGIIYSGETEFPGTTTFKVDAKGALSGTYELKEPDDTVVTGKLSDFRIVAKNKLECRWVDKNGEGTFDQVLAAARLLQKHEVDFNILCTVHAANGDRPLDVYRYFRDEIKADFIQFIPIIERATPELLPVANRGWGDQHLPSEAELQELPIAKSSKRPLYTLEGSLVTERSIKPELWGKFMIGVFDEWVRNDVGTVFVQMFDSALGSWVGRGASLCIHVETCGYALALEHNGDLYSCDHFVEPRYLLGNIKETHMLELVASNQQLKFGNDKRDTLPQYCLDCEVRFACNGGCPRNRFIETPDGEAGLNYLCAGYKAFFKHIDRPMKLMAMLLRKNRYADEVMGILAAEEKQGE